jgi:hypothetical protein
MTRFVALSGSVLLFSSVFGWSLELAAPVEQPLSGESRLNTRDAGANPLNSEHEIMHFWVEAEAWSGRYDKHPEPTLGFPNPPDGTFGMFTGAVATNFVCQPTFPFYPCHDVVQVVEGTTRYSPPGRPPFDIHQQHIVVRERNGHEVMWQHFVSPGNFACPWYRDFKEALAANHSTAHGDCIFQVRSPAQESNSLPTEQAQLEIARSLDMDYRKCAGVVLSDQIRQLTRADTAYVSIMGEDPDTATLKSLRRLQARIEPGSKMSPLKDDSRHTNLWLFYFGDLRQVSPGEYIASAGFHCGSLCAAATEYRLQKDGNSCSVFSSRILWQS